MTASEGGLARRDGEAKGPGRGGPARGYKWPPFEKGHTLSTRHGSYATLALRPRAEELAQGLRVVLADDYSPRYEIAIDACALVMARIERAHAALDDATDPKELSRLDGDVRSWMRQLLAWLNSMGLTPSSAAKLGLDVAKSRHEERLANYLAERYGGAVDGDADAS